MNKQIDDIKKTRIYLINHLENLSIDQLNKIPNGFNNNIAWNLGHMLAAQQGLCYLRAGVPVVVEEKYYSLFKPGTKPEAAIDSKELEKIKSLMLTTLDQLDKDCETDLFKDYNSFQTRYGAELSNINDAINFLPYHEGLHSGVILAIKKILSK